MIDDSEERDQRSEPLKQQQQESVVKRRERQILNKQKTLGSVYKSQ